MISDIRNTDRKRIVRFMGRPLFSAGRIVNSHPPLDIDARFEGRLDHN
jgi:hypothetical protein